jgi:GntR family transcriptional regulator, transcriptional repressor for pyruvate dehydrogenase complex
VNVTEFKPVNKVLISNGIIEQIKTAIAAGNLKPGDSLPSEIRMASQLKVGRSTVREALQVLIHLGFIERKSKETFVSPSVRERLFPKDILQSYQAHRRIMEMIEVRKVVESFLAESSAIRAHEEVIDLLRRDLDEMERSIGDMERFIASDHQFHLRIAEGAQNKVFYDLMLGIRDILKDNQGLVLLKSQSILPRSMEFHRKIYLAIKGKKPKMARKYMLDHLIDIEKEMYHILKTE